MHARVFTTTADRDPYLLRVGLRIRAQRVLQQVSQEDLARRSGVSRVTLGSIERATTPRPSRPTWPSPTGSASTWVTC